jgi:quinol monooxygenase YgiN
VPRVCRWTVPGNRTGPDETTHLSDPNVLIAIEVFEDREAMARQEEQPAVAGVVELLQSGALAEQPQWTIYEVAPAETPTLS